MSTVELILAFAVGIETPTILAGIYFLKHKVKAVIPAPVPTPAAPAVLAAVQVAPTVKTTTASQSLVYCSKCGHFVARYTPTTNGPVCANCQPID